MKVIAALVLSVSFIAGLIHRNRNSKMGNGEIITFETEKSQYTGIVDRKTLNVLPQPKVNDKVIKSHKLGKHRSFSGNVDAFGQN